MDNTIFVILMGAIIVACVLLGIVILAQNSKGGGLSGAFGGNSSASFGIQRTNDFMERATWTLGITIVGLIFLSVVLTAKPSKIAVPTNTPQNTEAQQKSQQNQPVATPTNNTNTEK